MQLVECSLFIAMRVCGLVVRAHDFNLIKQESIRNNTGSDSIIIRLCSKANFTYLVICEQLH